VVWIGLRIEVITDADIQPFHMIESIRESVTDANSCLEIIIRS